MARTVYHAFSFVVQGCGAIPIDMLRYDRCCPADLDAVTEMGTREPYRMIRLIGYAPVGTKQEPTTGRWASFGWRVLPETVKPVTL